jgi:hypothetical protein
MRGNSQDARAFNAAGGGFLTNHEIENNITRIRGVHMRSPQSQSPIVGYAFDRAADLADSSQRQRLSASAIKAFLNIARRWNLTEEHSRALLGGIASSTYHAWKTDPKRTKLTQDTLMRISLLIGIYKALHIYFGEPWADRWVRLENRGALFSGQAPIEFLIRRGQPGMVEVRRMLDAWRGGR